MWRYRVGMVLALGLAGCGDVLDEYGVDALEAGRHDVIDGAEIVRPAERLSRPGESDGGWAGIDVSVDAMQDGERRFDEVRALLHDVTVPSFMASGTEREICVLLGAFIPAMYGFGVAPGIPSKGEPLEQVVERRPAPRPGPGQTAVEPGGPRLGLGSQAERIMDVRFPGGPLQNLVDLYGRLGVAVSVDWRTAQVLCGGPVSELSGEIVVTLSELELQPSEVAALCERGAVVCIRRGGGWLLRGSADRVSVVWRVLRDLEAAAGPWAGWRWRSVVEKGDRVALRDWLARVGWHDTVVWSGWGIWVPSPVYEAVDGVVSAIEAGPARCVWFERALAVADVEGLLAYVGARVGAVGCDVADDGVDVDGTGVVPEVEAENVDTLEEEDAATVREAPVRDVEVEEGESAPGLANAGDVRWDDERGGASSAGALGREAAEEGVGIRYDEARGRVFGWVLSESVATLAEALERGAPSLNGVWIEGAVVGFGRTEGVSLNASVAWSEAALEDVVTASASGLSLALGSFTASLAGSAGTDGALQVSRFGFAALVGQEASFGVQRTFRVADGAIVDEVGTVRETVGSESEGLNVSATAFRRGAGWLIDYNVSSSEGAGSAGGLASVSRSGRVLQTDGRGVVVLVVRDETAIRTLGLAAGWSDTDSIALAAIVLRAEGGRMVVSPETEVGPEW